MTDKRTVEVYPCANCGRDFHPLVRSKRLYCSPRCNYAAFGRSGRKAKPARALWVPRLELMPEEARKLRTNLADGLRKLLAGPIPGVEDGGER